MRVRSGPVGSVKWNLAIIRQGSAPGEAKRYAPPDDGSSTVAHLWWPAVAKLRAASVPIARQLRHGTDRRTDRAKPNCPHGGGHDRFTLTCWISSVGSQHDATRICCGAPAPAARRPQLSLDICYRRKPAITPLLLLIDGTYRRTE